MLKTSFGKVIVGVVALSGVATHAADMVRGYTADGQFVGKVQPTSEGWANKFPTRASDTSFNVQAGAELAPIYGVESSVQAIVAPFWGTGQTEKAEGELKYVPAQTVIGALAKVNLFSITENASFFGQFGAGVVVPRKEPLANLFGAGLIGAGVKYNFNSRWNGVFDYKHIQPLGTKAAGLNHFGTFSAGAKYNWI